MRAISKAGWLLVPLFLAGCGDDGSGGDVAPEPGAPDVFGGYAVSMIEMELVDASRDDRSLRANVWYPARPAPEDAALVYSIPFGGGSLADLPSPNGSTAGSQPDLRGGPYPVVLFSHGNGGLRFQNGFQCEWLASHGYVVIAPDHTGNTALDFASGNVDQASAANRPADMSFVLDELLAASDGDHPVLSGMADPTRVGITGHSYGGYTSLALAGASIGRAVGRTFCDAVPDAWICDQLPTGTERFSFRDARVDAALPLAPGLFQAFGSAGIADVAVPTFIQGGDRDLTTPWEADQQPVYDALQVPRFSMQIAGAGHFSFSDMCRLPDSVLGLLGNGVQDDGCGDNNLEFEIVQQHVNAYGQAFMDRYVRGDTAPSIYLDGTHAESDDALSFTSAP